MHQLFTSRSQRKLLLVHVAAAFACFAAPFSRSQEVAVPEASPTIPPELLPSPSAGAAATPAPSIPAPQLIPPDILPMPDPSAPPGAPAPETTLQQLDEQLKPKSISQAAEDYRLHTEWRKLRNVAQNDPTVKAAFAEAQRAHTDLEKRRLMARYFDVLFDKEIALGPKDMKDYLNDRRREHIAGLAQPRVRPSPTPKPDAKNPDGDSGIRTHSLASTPTPTPVATPSPPAGFYPSPPGIH